MNFASALLKSTRGWDEGTWWNDRQIPGRPWKFCPDWALIDGLLSTSPTSRNAFLRRLINDTRELTSQTKAMHRHETMHFSGWADWFYKKRQPTQRGWTSPVAHALRTPPTGGSPGDIQITGLNDKA